MATANIPKLLLDQHFADLNEYARQIGWDIEFRQLDAGVPRARAALMGTANCMLMRGEYNRAYHQSGQMPDDMLVLGFPDPDSGDFRWCGKNASGGQIVNFSLANGFDGTCGAGFAGFTIALHHDLLQETCETLELDVDFRRFSGRHEVFPNSDFAAMNFRHHLLTAFASAQFSNNVEAVEFFNFSAGAFVLDYFATHDNEVKRALPGERHRAAHAALEWLENVDVMPLTVSELCKNVGTSAPTLYRAFQEQFGVSPKRYIQIRRMCGARQQLFARKPEESIADVANNWGFWHMGQFAADYRQHFGELPSATQTQEQ
jgi:AraC family ethanolamine operon transcriptional activator